METPSQPAEITSLDQYRSNQQQDPNVAALVRSQRYRLWELGLVALSATERAILHSVQPLEV